MTQAIKKYAIDLKNTGISKEMLQQVKEILEAVPQIQADFENPTVEIAKKHLVIERVFPTEVRNFIKILCDNNEFQLFDQIYDEFSNLGKDPEKKNDYAEFLTDLEQNKGKSMWLETACNLGYIQDKADMDKFVEMYQTMAKHEREFAIKEYEAQKVIDETKNKAVIDGTNAAYTSNVKPTAADVSKMTQAQFDAAVAKYGFDWIYE